MPIRQSAGEAAGRGRAPPPRRKRRSHRKGFLGNFTSKGTYAPRRTRRSSRTGWEAGQNAEPATAFDVLLRKVVFPNTSSVQKASEVTGASATSGVIRHFSQNMSSSSGSV